MDKEEKEVATGVGEKEECNMFLGLMYFFVSSSPCMNKYIFFLSFIFSIWSFLKIFLDFPRIFMFLLK